MKLCIDGVVFDACGATVEVSAECGIGRAASFALLAARAGPWWIGDLLADGERLWGDAVWQAMQAGGHSLSQLERYLGVARAVPRENRREDLSWTHHAYVARLPHAAQRELLTEAASEGLTSAELYSRVREWRSEHAEDPRCVRHGAG